MKLTRRVLYLKAKPVTFKYPLRNQQTAMSMLEFMRNNGGIGLAATQVGLRERILVMDINGWVRMCFNPEITAVSSDVAQDTEGCLSFPAQSCIVTRNAWVDVSYQDHEGHVHTERLTDLQARCFQHELDHLEGITMWDRNKEQYAEQS
jgi:peptide deformylase